MTLNKEEYRVATFHDETKAKALQKLEMQSQLMTKLQTSVKHEMITPLKCISGFAKTIEQELVIKNSARCRDAHMIYVTSQLLLSEVNMLLDKSMIDNHIFKLNLEYIPINRIVYDAIQIIY